VPLGESTYGTVWSARDAKLRRTVVVTVLNESAPARVRERFEALIEGGIVGLRAPTLSRVLAAGHGTDGLPYLASEFHADASSLADHMQSGPAIKVAAAVRILVDLLGSVSKLGATGLTHGDISPGNVLILEQRGRVSPRLIGLGLNRTAVREGHDEMTSPTHLRSLGYLAPEQTGDSPRSGASADLFSTAGLLFDWITGRPPFRGETAEAVRDAAARLHVPRVGALRPELAGTELASVLDRALARDPADRFKDGAAFVTKLRASVIMTRAARELDVVVGERSMAPDDSDEALSEARTRPEEARAIPAATRPSSAKPSVKVSPPGAPKSQARTPGRPRRRPRRSTVIGFAPAVAPTAPNPPEESNVSPPEETGGPPANPVPDEGEVFDELSGLLMISENEAPARVKAKAPPPPPTPRSVTAKSPSASAPQPDDQPDGPDEELDAMLDDLEVDLGEATAKKPKGEATPSTDAEQSGAEQSGTEDKQSGTEDTDANDSDTGDSDATDSDAEASAFDSDAEPSDANDSDAEASDANDSDATDGDAKDGVASVGDTTDGNADDRSAQDGSATDEDEENSAAVCDAGDADATDGDAESSDSGTTDAVASPAPNRSEAGGAGGKKDEAKARLPPAEAAGSDVEPDLLASAPPAMASTLGAADDDVVLPGASPPWMWIGVGAAVAAAAVVGLVWFASGDSNEASSSTAEVAEIAAEPEPEPEEVATPELPPEEPDPEPEPVAEEPLAPLTMTLSGLPEGAAVTVDGEPLSGVEVVITEGPRDVAVTMEGFEPWAQTLDRDSPETLEIELVAVESPEEDGAAEDGAAEEEAEGAEPPPELTRAQRRRRAVLRRRRRERRRAQARERERAAAGVGPNPY
ncbi:MAG: hypothetical protein AB8I08_39285, partial [Sandaracinaceae bacterium]